MIILRKLATPTVIFPLLAIIGLIAIILNFLGEYMSLAILYLIAIILVILAMLTTAYITTLELIDFYKQKRDGKNND